MPIQLPGSNVITHGPNAGQVPGPPQTVTEPVVVEDGGGVLSVDDGGSSLTVDGSVTVSNLPVTYPIAGSVSVTNHPSSIAVTGTFWPATQPISGSVSVSNFPVSQPVTGTFWQSVQPVSISGVVLQKPYTPASSDILSNSVIVTNSVASTVIITIPAGRMWRGEITVTAQSASTAVSVQNARVITVGTGAIPAPNTALVLAASQSTASGPNSNTVTVHVAAPIGNAVTLNLVNSTATTFTGVASCSGVLL